MAEPFHDTPAPYILYRRNISNDTKDQRVKWILLFQAELLINSIEELKPKNETNSIICLSREMLMKLSDPIESLTVRDIKNSKDGSCIIPSNAYSENATLHPKGMVSIISMSTFPHFN